MGLIIDLLARPTADRSGTAQELRSERFVSRSTPCCVTGAVGSAVARSVDYAAESCAACCKAAHESLNER